MIRKINIHNPEDNCDNIEDANIKCAENLEPFAQYDTQLFAKEKNA